jgi:hypothetical protein
MIFSYKVQTTLSAYRIVNAVTGTAQTVKYPATSSESLLGITKDTVLDTTGSIPVAGPGEIALLYFNDTCTCGNLVSADSSGRGVPYADVSAGTYSIGTLIDATVAATGTIARVLINPDWRSLS